MRAGCPWETNTKKEPKKKAAPAPKGKRVDGPRDGPRENSERQRGPRQDKERAPRPAGKGKIHNSKSPTNVTEPNAAPAAKAPLAAPQQQRAANPAPAPAPAPSGAPAVTGNQWARGPPRPKQPEEEIPAAPAPVVEEQQPAQQKTEAPAPPVKAWGNAQQSKQVLGNEGKDTVTRVAPTRNAPTRAAPPPAPAPAPEPVVPQPAPPAHHSAHIEQTPTTADTAASQMAMQQQYQQHAANTDTMASLNLNQPAAAPAPSAFDAHANATASYDGIGQMPANNSGKMYGSFQQNTGLQMPQGMYGGAGFDATGVASSTGAMGFNAKMMPQQNFTSTFGMDQDTSAPTGQTSQQSLLYQQQQYMMAMASGMNGYGGFPGAYGNMAAMYGYGLGAGYGAGYGGMPNSMGYGGMPNTMNTGTSQGYSGNSQGAGYGNGNKQSHSRKQHHNNHNNHNNNTNNNNSGYGGNSGYAGNSYGNQAQAQALHNFNADSQPGYSGAGYGNLMGNMGGMQSMGGDSSSQSSSLYAQQQQQQQQQQQPFGGSMGASSQSMNNSRYNMGAANMWAS